MSKDDEGWIPHDGGKIPCDGKLAVDVKFQNGIVDTHGAPAAYWLWERDSQIGYDIVFWRPHKNADGQAGQEPVAWAVTFDGLFIARNIFTNEKTARITLDNLNHAHPDGTRRLVPLYVHPAPSQEGHAAGPACSAPVYRHYQRKQIAEMADWHEGFDMAGVSVSEADKSAGSPKPGDKIARNPKNHADRWLVAADYFAENFSFCSAPDEALIEEIIESYYRGWTAVELMSFRDAAGIAIREYIRRSAGKEKG